MSTLFLADPTIAAVLPQSSSDPQRHSVVHLYLDVSGLNAVPDHMLQIAAGIELADALGVALKVTPFAGAISFTYTFTGSHLGPGEEAQLIVAAIEPYIGIEGTSLEAVWADLDQHLATGNDELDLVIISTDFFVDAPSKLPTWLALESLDVFYTPLGAADQQRPGVIETFLTTFLTKHDLNQQIIVGVGDDASALFARQIGEAHQQRVLAAFQAQIEQDEASEVELDAVIAAGLQPHHDEGTE